MRRRDLRSFRAGIAALTLGLCATPYVGLALYLVLGMHGDTVEASLPSAWILSGLFVLGVAVPGVGVTLTVRWVLRDRLHFQLAGLLKAYGALVLLFASSYAIIQASRIEPSFGGMAVLWDPAETATLGEHMVRLHALFFESLYLSIVTITTVGYGDLVPLTPLGKVLTAIEGLVGIGFVGVALGHYFSVCQRRPPTQTSS